MGRRPAWLEEARREVLAAAQDTWRSEAEKDVVAAGPEWPVEWGAWLTGLSSQTGDRERAVAVTEEAEELALRAGVPSAEGAALRCRGMLEGDTALLLRAVEAYRQGPRLAELAYACEDAGRALARASRVAEGVALLEEALGIHQRAGATRDVTRTTAALVRLR